MIALCCTALPLAGCGVAGSLSAVSSGPPAELRGVVMGGQNPVSGAAIALYAVGTAGDASAATSILTTAVMTDVDGVFHLKGAYQCPVGSALVYVVAVGGDPGVGKANAALAMMALVGTCDSLASATALQVNEVTTVAATAALAGFMSSGSRVGSSAAHSDALLAGFTLAAELVNAATGSAPGANAPTGATVPTAKINTLADAVASCVNTAGGVAGDGSPCGVLLARTAPSGGAAPVDTITALVNVAAQPTLNTAGIYALASSQPPFQPRLTSTPPDFAIGLVYASGLAVSSDSLGFAATYVSWPSVSRMVTLSNMAGSAISLSGMQMLGASAAEYGETDNCPAMLAAQSSCSVWVVFTPAAAGTRAAYLSIRNGVGQALGVSVSGQGVVNPPATYSPALNQTTVFMGASIVQYWPLPSNDRGIAGQVTSQMLARFQSDVLGHGYARVVILGGSNDILLSVANVPAELLSNIAAMAQMASASGMEVVLSELPPSSQLPTNGVPFNTTVAAVNAGIRQLAVQNGYLLLDFNTPMSGHPEYFSDGLHPNAAGYAVMERVLAGVVSH